jgi:hypothetical protein
VDWADARAILRGPIFAPVSLLLERLPRDRWPSRDELTVLAHGISTGSGAPLSFVVPRGNGDPPRPYYELYIAKAGCVETRAENWHDLFNALAWIAYPKAKVAINAQHVAIIEAGGAAEARRRSPARDALTLFDEGGVAVASADPELTRLMLGHEWKVLFWERRAELLRSMAFFAFGHSLFEKGLAPFIGIVAKVVVFDVDHGFLALDAESQRREIDGRLAEHFSERANFESPRAMPVLPVLGIPGWHALTSEESFYDDRSHFRPDSRKRGQVTFPQ